MNELQVFNYGDGERPMRTVEIDGEVWFVAKDVCDILELDNVTKALYGLDNDEKSSVKISDSFQDNTLTLSKSIQGRGNPNMNIISEPGLYKLAFKSKKPIAKKFVRWVTHDVLPAIRRTGQYKISEPSVETGLQRVGLIIRAAEHKAMPQSEQLRLLSLAVRDLTGTELNLYAQQKCQVLGLNELPEVFGFIKKGKAKNLGRGKGMVQFYSLLEISDILGITPSEFNGFADEHNLKSAYNGEWVRVETPQGEAREFVYIQSVISDYREEVK